MEVTEKLAAKVGTQSACDALGVPRSSLYEHRQRQRQPAPEPKKRPSPPRALSPQERQAVIDVLHQDRFVDKAPDEVYATLLDEETYYCCPRTMYRILASEDEVRERRNQKRHPEYVKPELLATAPNQVWSWDTTKLKGPATWTYFYLYVIIDIFSRYVVGWMVAERENAAHATRLIRETCDKEGIAPDMLTIHSDRGAPMIAKTTAQLMASMGVIKSHSRPYVSDDNPFSESHFKTLKYRPDFPERFGCLEDTLAFCRPFFRWYNLDHRHSGIGLLTPQSVHHGQAEHIRQARQRVLDKAYAAHPERFLKGQPKPPLLPQAVYINPPALTAGEDSGSSEKTQ